MELPSTCPSSSRAGSSPLLPPWPGVVPISTPGCPLAVVEVVPQARSMVVLWVAAAAVVVAVTGVLPLVALGLDPTSIDQAPGRRPDRRQGVHQAREAAGAGTVAPHGAPTPLLEGRLRGAAGFAGAVTVLAVRAEVGAGAAPTTATVVGAGPGVTADLTGTGEGLHMLEGL